MFKLPDRYRLRFQFEGHVGMPVKLRVFHHSTDPSQRAIYAIKLGNWLDFKEVAQDCFEALLQELSAEALKPLSEAKGFQSPSLARDLTKTGPPSPTPARARSDS